MSGLKIEDLERIGLRDGVDQIYIEARFKDGQKFSIAEFPIECESICVEVFNFLNERIANEASTSKEQALNIGGVVGRSEQLVCDICEEPLEKVLGRVCENTMCDRYR